MTSITITAEHLTSAVGAADGAIFLTPAGTVEAGSLLYPLGKVLITAASAARWIWAARNGGPHDATKDEVLNVAAQALTIMVRDELDNEA